MKQKQGWIKLPREIMNHWLWLDARKLQMWIAMVFMAQYEARKTVMVDNVEVTLYRGDFFMSLRKLAQRLGCSKNTLQTFLRVLESQGMISRITMHKITIISILDFDLYCGGEESEESPESKENNGGAGAKSDGEKGRRRFRYAGRKRKEKKGVKDAPKKAAGNGAENAPESAKKECEKSPVPGQLLTPSKEKRNIISTTSPSAPACEAGSGIEGERDSAETEKKYFERFKAEQITLEAIANATQAPDTKILLEAAARFFAEQTAKEKRHTDYADFKRHFINWVRIDLRKSGGAGNDKSTTQTRKNYATDTEKPYRPAGDDRLRDRRPTDSGDPKRKNYDTPF